MQMIVKRSLLLILAFSVLRARALATAPAEQHEASRRTAQRHGGYALATAGVDDKGEVDLRLRESPICTNQAGITTCVSSNTAFGSVMLQVLFPTMFARNTSVQAATLSAIRTVAIESGTSVPVLVTDARVSLSVLPQYPEFVRVEFHVTFSTLRGRQTFVQSMVTDGGNKIASKIGQQVPLPYTGRCELPGVDTSLGLLGLNLGYSYISEEDLSSTSPAAGGSILLTPPVSVVEFLRSSRWQEAVAMAIANMAFVSRTQVGTLAAAESSLTVRVDYWIMDANATEASQAVLRVQTADAATLTRTVTRTNNIWARVDQQAMDIVFYGRIVLQVPSARSFVSSSTAAVQDAVSNVAQDLQLAVSAASASLVVLDSALNTVRIGFQLVFGSARDRQVFELDAALDGAQKIANSINKRTSACQGTCRFLQAAQPTGIVVDLNTPPWRTMWLWLSVANLLANSQLALDAWVMAIAEIASASTSQVGLVMHPRTSGILLNFWIASSQIPTRKAFVQRMMQVNFSEFPRRALLQLDRLSGVTTRDAHGSITLSVPEAERFANSTAVIGALRNGIAAVANVSSTQVLDVQVSDGLFDKFPDAVLVSFRITFTSRLTQEALIRKFSSDGGEELGNSMCNAVPAPWWGNCRIPGQRLQKAVNQAYGTMRLYLFSPDRFVRDADARARMATAIAGVALVPPVQVNMMTSAESAAMASVGFWVTSGDAAAREAAVQRVNSMWNQENLRPIRRTQGDGSYFGPAFMACTGTVRC